MLPGGRRTDFSTVLFDWLGLLPNWLSAGETSEGPGRRRYRAHRRLSPAVPTSSGRTERCRRPSCAATSKRSACRSVSSKVTVFGMRDSAVNTPRFGARGRLAGRAERLIDGNDAHVAQHGFSRPSCVPASAPDRSRLCVRITSTRSPGRTSPATLCGASTEIDTARVPGLSAAERNCRSLGLTRSEATIGSPAANGRRFTAPMNSLCETCPRNRLPGPTWLGADLFPAECRQAAARCRSAISRLATSTAGFGGGGPWATPLADLVVPDHGQRDAAEQTKRAYNKQEIPDEHW